MLCRQPLLHVKKPWAKVSNLMVVSKVLKGERLPVDYHQQPEVSDSSLSCDAVIVT